MSSFVLSVCTFGRVFDVHPAPDALTLAELTEALSRFQLKSELHRKEQRELERARRAHAALARGEAAEGPMLKRLERHLARHAEAADRFDLALADLERDIRREAKQDLRLWAPILFRPGARREDESVVHLSALVLDFDRGPEPAALRETFAGFWHHAHSTWSHTPEHPKLRLVLPFAAPVGPADYDAVWHYADGLAGNVADPTGRALARAWALPAVPTPERERLAWTHPGPLFDAVALGLAASSEPTPPPAPTFVSFLRKDPEETWLAPTGPSGPEGPTGDTGATSEATVPEPDPWDGGAILPHGTLSRDPRRTPDLARLVEAPAPVAPPLAVPSSREPSARPEAPAAAPPEVAEPDAFARMQARLDALEARLVVLERALADYL